MLKMAIGILSTAIAVGSVAQTSNLVAPPTSELATNAPPPPVEPVVGVIREKVAIIDRISDFCDERGASGTSIAPGAKVLVLMRLPCTSRYGRAYDKDLLQVLYAGTTAMLPAAAVILNSSESAKLDGLTTDLKESNLDAWMKISRLLRQQEIKAGLKTFESAVESTAKKGLTLVSSSIFDSSEYTQGTGFSATVYNPTKKIVKYVTFRIIGLNAVGDPVNNRITGKIQTLRGIGPILPGKSATYSNEYMWMTDIVDNYRFVTVKVEYTDGSSKLINNLRPIHIPDETLTTLTGQ